MAQEQNRGNRGEEIIVLEGQIEISQWIKEKIGRKKMNRASEIRGTSIKGLPFISLEPWVRGKRHQG